MKSREENEVHTRFKTCCSQGEVADPYTQQANDYADEPEGDRDRGI